VGGGNGQMNVTCSHITFVGKGKEKGKPLLDSEDTPIVKNYPHRKQNMIDDERRSNDISVSIRYEDMPTINSLVKIKYEGRDCLAVMVRLAEY
jgi:hypothetical protein